ncbi:hypothetical protein Tco_0840149 [Tanacetum coccineum]|uniref:Uncharacterized protein n=1 Tax=Tanacetum coccineum TaxID=301880 RepID=A0ABQ5AV66_9ASTR
MIGLLNVLWGLHSRPDIMFAVCAYSRFQVTPKTSHLSAVKRIFRYLKGKPKLGLWYPRESSFDLESYSDSDYAGANLVRNHQQEGCQFLGKEDSITWQCKKQTIVATSTTEAEYVAAASCCGQVLWIQNQMLDYGFNFMNTKIYIDNESTICIVKNPVYHSKTKHIAIRHHFIRDAYEKKLIQCRVIKFCALCGTSDKQFGKLMFALQKCWPLFKSRKFEGIPAMYEKIKRDSSKEEEIKKELRKDVKERDKERKVQEREAPGVHTLMTDEGLVVHMLIEKKYPLKKEIVMQMLKLKLESKEESTMALELIRFIKKVLADLESKE